RGSSNPVTEKVGSDVTNARGMFSIPGEKRKNGTYKAVVVWDELAYWIYYADDNSAVGDETMVASCLGAKAAL
ncbi:MAG: hypothetical protein ACLGHL_10915, partial [Actinomycetota bacterium]